MMPHQFDDPGEFVVVEATRAGEETPEMEILLREEQDRLGRFAVPAGPADLPSRPARPVSW